MTRRAVFLDKDGTLVLNERHNRDSDKVVLAAGVLEGLKELQAREYLLVVVSNQGGVARGLITAGELDSVWNRTFQLFEQTGVTLDAFYYCPHHPSGTIPALTGACACRKPASGLLVKAAHDLDIDLPNSWIVGNMPTDMQAGVRAGCRGIPVRGQGIPEAPGDPWAGWDPRSIMASVDAAARLIVKHDLAGSRAMTEQTLPN